MTVPYSFGAATSAIPLSQLDSNFNTPITLGNTAIQLGNTVTTLNNMTLANVTISSGNVTITNVTVTTANATTVNTTTLIATTANVTTGNVTNLISGNVSLTGGSITGTPISGSTGSFTTLTTSSTVTLNGGLANAVQYLDGSKVLSSDANFVYNATGLGIGTSSPSQKLDVLGSIAVRASTSGANQDVIALRALNSDNTAYANAIYYANSHRWAYAGATEGMRLDSAGNLGIGTSSPGSRLTVKPSATSNGTFDVLTGSTNTDSIRLSGGGTVNSWLELRGYLGVKLYSDSTNTVTVDAAGNLGLGVTPSAWGLNYKALEIVGAGAAIAANGSNTIHIGTGCYISSSGFTYSQTGTAVSRYQVSSGAHSWYTAPSGTAGNAISFTQAMTLDASGKLLLGTTSLVANEQFTMFGAYAAFANASYTAYLGAAASILNSGSASDFAIRSNNNLVFSAGGDTERARIDSSGNLLVGTAANAGGAAQIGVLFAGNAANGINIKDSTTTSGSEFIAFYNSSDTKIGSISRNGTTNAVLYNTTSDQRLKENIIDAPEFGGVIDLIKVRSYDWKSDHTHQRAGFIAQELITIAPEAVYQPKNPEEMMAVDYSKLVPMLIKELQSLRARVAQLESKGA